MATGMLRSVNHRRGRWGDSCMMEACDNALALEGVNRGDYLVVDRGAMPRDGEDALVVVQRSGPQPVDNRKNCAPRLYLRKMERIGSKVSLQPGSSPRSAPYLPQEAAGIWGTVVAVMRKFEAA